ncbi:MAG: hypothetical protein AABW47_01420 [Nanoarchaeota archaeon]
METQYRFPPGDYSQEDVEKILCLEKYLKKLENLPPLNDGKIWKKIEMYFDRSRREVCYIVRYYQEGSSKLISSKSVYGKELEIVEDYSI